MSDAHSGVNTSGANPPSMMQLDDPSMDPKLMAILDDYLERAEEGERMDPEALIAEHPEYADRLREFLASIDFLNQAAPQVDLSESDPIGNWTLVNRTLGEFRIIREIGRGGMGVVYEATQESLDRRVALKVLPFTAMLDDKQIARFLNEAQTAAQLHHPNIVPVYSIGCDEGIHFYSMQIIDGRPLDRALASFREITTYDQASPSELTQDAPDSTEAEQPSKSDSSLSIQNRRHIDAIASLGVQAAAALQHAHDYGVVHRDIKPSNLLVDREGKLWVTDFGLARSQAEANITMTGDVIGTVRYMSPEQAAGKNSLIDHRTDVYSLGVTLYELLTLKRAFDADDRQEYLHKIENQDPKPLRSINPAIPVDLENVVLKAMSKHREHRYQNAEELALDLTRYLEGKPTIAKRPSLLDRATKWASRHRNFVAASMAVLLLMSVTMTVATLIVSREQAATQNALTKQIESEKKADRNFRQAREVVDKLGTQIADRLEGMPGADGIRQEVLSTTLEYYLQFASQVDADDSFTSELAATHYRTGQVLARIGDPKQAIEHFSRARESLAMLHEADPENESVHRDLALCCNQLGLILASQNQKSKAHESLLEAKKHLAQLSEEAADSSEEWRSQLAVVDANLGMMSLEAGRTEDAQKFFEDSIQQHQAVIATTEANVDTLAQFALTLNNMSYVLRDSDIERAVECAAKGISIYEKLAFKDTSGTNAFEADHALALNNLASLYSRQGQYSQAVAQLEKSVQLMTNLARKSREDHEKIHQLAITYNNLGRARLKLDQSESAWTAFLQAVQLLQGITATKDAPWEYHACLGGVLNNQATVLRDRSEWTKATKLCTEALQHHRTALARTTNRQLCQSYIAVTEKNLKQIQQRQAHDQKATDNEASAEVRRLISRVDGATHHRGEQP